METRDVPLLFTIERGIGHIKLNRPQLGNAIDAEMARSLLDAALSCASDPSVRAVVLEGAGKNFSYGGDIRSFHAAGEDLPLEIEKIITPLNAALAVLMRMQAPVVAVVRGVAAGGGLGLAIAADLILAAHSASFRAAYTAIGFCGDAGTTFMLPRLIGLRLARELMLTNRTVGADEARSMGLIDEVHEDGELTERAWQLARQLAKGSPLAHGAVKNLLIESYATSLEQQLAAEARSMVALARTRDAHRAIAAFLEKRSPDFEAR